ESLHQTRGDSVLLDAVAQAASLVQYRDTAVSHAFVTGYQCALAARLEERGFASDVGLMKLVDRLPSPDLLVFLRIPTEVALSRIHQRTKGDGLLATADPLAAVTLRQCALQLSSERFGAVELDATAPAAVLVDHVVGLIEQQPSEGRPPG
ncbi:hypothetical protein, partial [Nocardioides sp. CF8]|uniref:hypothetical protein n=1 Tax=Nocardioides sp. CF8 TaxID=110319 RepID=UPI00056B2942